MSKPKKYLREKKKWVTEEEYDKFYSSHDKKLCRGGKPHDFVLVLPTHVKYDENIYKFNPEDYYKLMEEEYQFFEEQKKKMLAMGVTYGRWNSKPYRLYMCSVCKKQNYIHEE